MTEIKIDKDVKMPDSRQVAKLYPIDDMQVGDSFFVETVGRLGVSTSMYGLFKLRQMRCTIRQVVEDGKKGMRVWRVK